MNCIQLAADWDR